MNIREVAPDTLEISDMNERTMPPKTSALVASVGEQGVIQPPIVRENDDGLEVVVGQRRTLAARKAGLPTLPVVVMDWGDADALEASITENIEAFQEQVTDNERGAAYSRLMKLRDCTQADVADRLGISPQSVRDALEGTRTEWEGTAFEPEFKRKKEDTSGSGQCGDIYSIADGGAQEVSAKVGGSTMRTIRNATEEEDKETREDMAHRVERGELNRSDVREIAESVDRGEEVSEAAERVEQSKDTAGGGTIGVNLTLPGDVSAELEDRAEADGVSNEEIIRRAVRQYLGVNQ